MAHTETSMVAVDPAGRIIALDDVGVRWIGSPAEEIIGKGPWFFGGLISEQEYPTIWLRLVEQGQLMMEGAIVSHTGQIFQLSLQFSYVPESALRGPYILIVAMRRQVVDAAEDDGSLTRLNFASAFIDDPLADWNVPADQITLNATACRMIGQPPGTLMSYAEGMETVPPQYRPHIDDQVARLIDGRADQTSLMRVVEVPGGQTRRLLVRVQVAARGGDGRARRIIAHGIDVTEQEAALASAREQQEMFAAVAQSSTAAIMVVDREGRFVFVNARAEAILGLPRDELLKRTCDDPQWRNSTPDGAPWPEDERPFRRIIRTGEPVYGVRYAIEWPDGSRRQLAINGEPIFDGEGRIHRVVFAVEDITEHYAAVQAVARSERKLREVLDRLSVGVHVVDGQGRAQFSNRMAEAMLRITPEDGDQRRISEEEHDTIDAEGRPYPLERYPIVRALAGRAVENEILGVRYSPDDIRWALISAVPSLDADGAVVDVVLQLSDITEQRHLERRLREGREVETIGRIAGGVAHEINNLLTTIVANVELIADALAPGDPQHADLAEIHAAAERGSALTRDLLGFARRQFRHRRAVRIGRLMVSIWRRLQGRLAGLEPVVAIDRELPTVHLDPEQFEQVFEGLIENARRAMGGRGRLRVTAERHTLGAGENEWPDLDPGPYVRLTVADSGPGVDPSIITHLFEPFVSVGQIDGRPRRGLGLANCHGIMRQNQGGVRLAANGPDGARFEVLWPVTADDPDG